MKTRTGVIISIAIYFVMFASVWVAEYMDKKSIHLLQPYDRVFYTAHGHCFHRDYHCKSIRYSKRIFGLSMVDAEKRGLSACSVCTEPYGMAMNSEEYRKIILSYDGKTENDDIIKVFYDLLISSGYDDVGTEKEFRNSLKDSVNIEKLYNALVTLEVIDEDDDESLTEDEFISMVKRELK